MDDGRTLPTYKRVKSTESWRETKATRRWLWRRGLKETTQEEEEEEEEGVVRWI
jgi:hypothetical protein